MRRALIALSLSCVVGVCLIIWALQPTTAGPNRSCGGGIFSVTAPDPGDDSFKDACDGVRVARAELIQAVTVPTGLVLLASFGWVVFLLTERRHIVA